jgi:HD domain-containing protein
MTLIQTETPLIRSATSWVVEQYPYNSYHLLRSLVWLDRLAPGSREAVRLATLTHDMERAFPGPDQPHSDDLNDMDYYRAHAERSARIVSAWLRDNAAAPNLIADVADLIRAHEFGGWSEANLVQAADSLSFLEVNIDLFLGMIRGGKRPAEQVRVKFRWTYDRIQIPEARLLALPMLDVANNRLAELLAEGKAVPD